MKKITGDSINERVEKFLSWKDRLPTFQRRGVEINKNDNITAVKSTFEADNTLHREWMYTHNLVTSIGDIYYAKKITLKKVMVQHTLIQILVPMVFFSIMMESQVQIIAFSKVV